MTAKINRRFFRLAGLSEAQSERLAVVYGLHAVQGLTFSSIAKLLGVSSGNISHQFRQAKYLVELAECDRPWTYGLSVRAQNVLGQYTDCKNKDDLLLRIRNGTIVLPKLRNCGRQAVNEIWKWLGQSGPLPNVPHKCPHCSKAIQIRYNNGSPVATEIAYVTA